jgi:FKBP-type peptidyl-prolyl cis-trans isomerase
MRTRTTLITSLLALAGVGLAGCGSSKAPGIQAAPSAGATQAAITPTTATSTTATTPTATTPKPPSPLSKKPVVTVPKAAAPTKLVIKDLITGTGPTAKVGQTVTVNYVGVLYKNGKEFDSSWSRGQPASFPLSNGGVIPGWVQGIPGMKVGGRRELIIPPNLAYGKSGSGSAIPPNSTLVFVVDLLSVS